MPRTIQPELLDTLPPHHPDALHSRRDLRLINRIMGNHRWLVRTLTTLTLPAEHGLELGAGMGELAHALSPKNRRIDGLDLWPEPSGWPETSRWHSADLRSFGEYASYPVIIGNLIFHHFTDTELAEVGAAISTHARLIVACEPARRSLSQFWFRTIAPLFGANHVTLHDARVSIAAGFRGDELPRLLGLTPALWHVDCHITPLGAYRMIAKRRP